MKWPTATLRQLSILGPQYGANLSAVEPNGRGIRYVRITDIDEFGQLRPESFAEPNDGDVSAYTLSDGDLLLARSGATVGKSYMHTDADGTCVFAGYLIRFRPNNQLVLPKFLKYYTHTPAYWSWINSKKRVAAQPNVNGAEYASLEIPLPPLSEQRRIVELLEQADALRRLRREADAKVARILPTLFLKMFGDPATNPMGWPVGTLSEFGGKVRYGLGQPPQQSETGVPLLRATNIDAGRIVEKNLVLVDSEDVPESRNAFLSANEVLVVRSGAYTGDVAQVTDKWAGSVAGYDMVVTPPSGWNGEFIEQYLLTSLIQRSYFESKKGRAGQPHLNAAQLEGTPIFAPTEAVQNAFSDHVRLVRELRDQCLANSDTVEKMFSTLLLKAFVGNLTSKWRQAHMQELVVEMQQQAKALNLSLPKEIAA